MSFLRWTDNQIKMAMGLITDGNHGRPGYGDGRKNDRDEYSDGLGSNTGNPHYWSTELNLRPATVKSFLRTLRNKGVLQTMPHPEGGICIDPDTRAYILDYGPNWDAFVDEYHALEGKTERMKAMTAKRLDWLV